LSSSLRAFDGPEKGPLLSLHLAAFPEFPHWVRNTFFEQFHRGGWDRVADTKTHLENSRLKKSLGFFSDLFGAHDALKVTVGCGEFFPGQTRAGQ
jgi:hypothetical protein